MVSQCLFCALNLWKWSSKSDFRCQGARLNRDLYLAWQHEIWSRTNWLLQHSDGGMNEDPVCIDYWVAMQADISAAIHTCCRELENRMLSIDMNNI